jgi:HlyD family secretion protein
MKQPPDLNPFRDIRVAARGGLVALCLLVGAAGIWATTAPIASAVIALGQVVVESNLRRIEHPTGGVVADILVDDGDRVQAGDVLVRLDATMARTNLAIVEIEYFQLLARKARLEAERDGLEGLVIPEALAARSADSSIAQLVDNERNLFGTRQTSTSGQISQLRERVLQTEQEITGLTAQLTATRDQLGIATDELERVRSLHDSDLVPITQVNALERQAAELSGQAGQLVAEIARAHGQMAEIELQILQIGRDLGREVTAELRDVVARIADLEERRIAALDQAERIELRAPQDGIVHQNTVHTIGGVVRPGEPIMLIVPQRDGLVVDARVDPRMIDRLEVGQPVTLRFTAFDSATTPDIDGTLDRISADVVNDSQSGASFYLVRIRMNERELAKLSGKTLLPGMPVETFINTGERTALAYVLKPFQDQIARAFRYD